MKFDIEDEDDQPKKKKSSYLSDQPIYIIVAVFLVAAAIILVVTYMILKSGNTPSTPPVEITTPTPTISPTTTETPTSDSLMVFDEESNERPIAVIIDNDIGEERHAGLLESYLNYEILIEGGKTRIMAVYKDRDAKLIGPITSSRYYFLDYALENDAIYVHYGSANYAKDDITKLKVDNINGLVTSDPFRRNTESPAPHNVFTRMSYLKSYLPSTNYSQESENWQVFNYSVDLIDLNDTGYVPKQANRVSIPYTGDEHRDYRYDEENQYYVRSSNGYTQYDRKSGKQLHYTNIIIERVPIKTVDKAGNQQLDTVGKGKAYYITNGYFLPITWSKSARNAKTKYTYEDGTEITLNDGNTFVHIVPMDCNLVIE